MRRRFKFFSIHHLIKHHLSSHFQSFLLFSGISPVILDQNTGEELDGECEGILGDDEMMR